MHGRRGHNPSSTLPSIRHIKAGVAYESLEARIVHEVVEELGMILRDVHDDLLKRRSALNTRIFAIRVFSCVLEHGVLHHLGRDLLRDHLQDSILIHLRDSIK